MTTPARHIFDSETLPLFEHGKNSNWLDRARATARYLARANGETNIVEVRKECPPPDGADPRIMGAVFSGKDFIKTRTINASRRECHGRPIGVFKLREAT